MATNPYQLSETELAPTQPLQGLEGTGALGTLNEEEQSTAYDIPVFQVKTYAPENLQNLQNVYGTQAMPIFEWAKKVQTGTVQYDPSSPIDQELLEEYRAAVEASGLPEGMPDPYDLSWEDVAKQTTLATVGAAAPAIGSNIYGALTDPYLAGGTADRLLAGTKSSLPFGGDLPSQAVNQSLSQGYDLVNAGGIGQNQIFVPELANAEVAAQTGNLDTYNTLQRLANQNQAGSVALDGSRSVYSSTPAKGQTTYSPEALKDVGIEVGADGKVTGGQNINSTVLTSTSQAPGYFQGVGDRLYGSQAGSTWGQAGTAALINFGVNVASGMKPTEAAKSAGAAGVAYAIGFALSGGNPWVASIVSTVAAEPIQKAGSKLVEETKGVLDSAGEVLGDAGKAVEKVVKAPIKVAKKVAAPVKKVFKKVFGGFGGFSDISLKDNIQRIGVSSDGINIYSWDWNEKAKEIGADSQPNKGLIAQDLLTSKPEAVFQDEDTGYLMIDYSKLD